MLRNGILLCSGVIALLLTAQASAVQQPSPSIRAAQAMAIGAEVARQVREIDQAPAELDLSNIQALRIEIRFQGELAGWGESDLDTAADPTEMLQQAIQTAQQRFRATMRGHADGLDPAQREALGKTLAISIELSERWVPLTGAQLTAPDLHLHRGIEGIGARAGNAVASTFPSSFHGQSPESVSYRRELSALAARVLDDPAAGLDTPTDLAQRRGVVFYRFHAIHLAEPAPGGAMQFMHRGGRLITETQAADPAWIGSLASSMTAFLTAQVNHQVQDQIPPALDLNTAQPLMRIGRGLSEELAMLALKRAAASDVLDPVSRKQASAALAHAWQTMELPDPDQLLPAHRAGLLWLALDDEHTPPDTRAHIEASLDRVLDQLDTIPWEGSPNEAIALYALARKHADNPEQRAALKNALSDLLTSGGLGGTVGLLPWAAFADAALHPDQPMQAETLFRQVRETMWRNQFTQQDAEAPTLDMVGGLVFAGPGGASLPTSATLRPLAFAAWAMRDERLTTRQEVLSSELLPVLRGIRFTGQLMVTPAEAYASSIPEKVVGGIRRTLWDNAVRTEDTAMALLVTLELMESLQALEKGEHPQP